MERGLERGTSTKDYWIGRMRYRIPASVIILWLAYFALVAFARCSDRAIITTYAKKYGEFHSRRYHPDSLNVASGWRWLMGHQLWLTSGIYRVRVTVKDVMNIRYEYCDTLHIDASPRVMKLLHLKGKSWITVEGIQ
jgi:hypothetical protein